MTISHHMKLDALRLYICIAFLTFEFEVENTKYLFTTVDTENMASEILRCHCLHTWKYHIVDAGRKQSPKKACPSSKGAGRSVCHYDVLQESKQEHLDGPACEVSHCSHSITPFLLLGQFGLVGQA